MGLFKQRPTEEPRKPFHISDDLFEEGGGYEVKDLGGGLMMITITSTKPLALVSQDEWDASKEELKKSRTFAANLQKQLADRDEEVAKLKSEIAQLKEEKEKLHLDLVTSMKEVDKLTTENAKVKKALKTASSALKRKAV